MLSKSHHEVALPSISEMILQPKKNKENNKKFAKMQYLQQT
jgi:hypothetical protein